MINFENYNLLSNLSVTVLYFHECGDLGFYCFAYYFINFDFFLPTFSFVFGMSLCIRPW